MDTVLVSQNKNLQRTHKTPYQKIRNMLQKVLTRTVTTPQTGDPQRTAEALLGEGPGFQTCLTNSSRKNWMMYIPKYFCLIIINFFMKILHFFHTAQKKNIYIEHRFSIVRSI